MGQKAHPIGLRLGIIRSWSSKWFARRGASQLLQEDNLIRRYTHRRLENAGIAEIEILRYPTKVTVNIHTSRPGIVIGRKGAEVDKLKEELALLTKKDITINIVEVKRPELSARLTAESIARQLEGRISYRRAMKKSIALAMKMGAEGVKIICGGRLAGAEIARTEKYMQGRVPLHTLRADIDFATATAHTTYGTIGVKCWICRGEVLDWQGAEEHRPTMRTEEDGRRGRERRDERGPRPERRGGRPGRGPDRSGSGRPEGRRPESKEKTVASAPAKPIAENLKKSSDLERKEKT